MARTFVQQSQISGSLSFDDKLAAGSELAGKQTLVGDLNALRSQINKIIGGDNWYDALSGSQDLADIYAALQVDGSKANFQGAMDVAGVADFDSAVFMAADLGVSGTLAVAQNATFAVDVDIDGTLSASHIKIDGDTTAGRLYIVGADGSITDEGELNYDGSKLGITGGLDVSAVADFGGDVFMDAALGVTGSLTVAGLADLNGALQVAGIADFAADVFMAADLSVSGSMTVADGLTVSGDRLEVTGSMGVTGAVDFDSTLNVDGVADFKADVYMAADLGVSGSASVAGALDAGSLEVAGLSDLNGALDVAGVADFASDVYMDAALGVSGSLTVAQAVDFDSTLNVAGVADFTSDVYMAAALGVSGSLTVAGNVNLGDNSADIVDIAGVLSASTIKIDLDEPQRLYIVGNDGELKDEAKLTFDQSELFIDGDLKVGGNDIKSSTGDIVMSFSGRDVYFKNDVHVAGDLIVTGTMTYIETENLKVKDAFIHLATGSTGTQNSGIVLHGGAGATADLMLAQDGGAGEFVFAKLAHGPNHDLVDGNNLVPVDGAELVAAWMNEVKLGGLEGSLSGSLSATAAGVALSSAAGKELAVTAASDLLLSANGETAISFVESGESAAFDIKFDATSIVGALNELFDMIGGGSAAKGDLDSGDVAANVLTFSSIGTLTAAEHKLIDVYLNGVLLSPTRDLSGLTTTTVTLDAAIASGLMVDDVITVVIRSAESP